MKAYLQLSHVAKNSIRDLQKLADVTSPYREQLLSSGRSAHPWRTGHPATKNNQLVVDDEETDEEEEDRDDGQEGYGGDAVDNGDNDGRNAAAGDQKGRKGTGNAMEGNKRTKAKGERKVGGHEERNDPANAEHSDGDLVSVDPDDYDHDDARATHAAYEAAMPLVVEALEGKQLTGLPLELKYTAAASIYANVKELESMGRDDVTYVPYMNSWIDKQHMIAGSTLSTSTGPGPSNSETTHATGSTHG